MPHQSVTTVGPTANSVSKIMPSQTWHHHYRHHYLHRYRRYNREHHHHHCHHRDQDTPLTSGAFLHCHTSCRQSSSVQRMHERQSLRPRKHLPVTITTVLATFYLQTLKLLFAGEVTLCVVAVVASGGGGGGGGNGSCIDG
jgi:hypothetical protein